MKIEIHSGRRKKNEEQRKGQRHKYIWRQKYTKEEERRMRNKERDRDINIYEDRKTLRKKREE